MLSLHTPLLIALSSVHKWTNTLIYLLDLKLALPPTSATKCLSLLIATALLYLCWLIRDAPIYRPNVSIGRYLPCWLPYRQIIIIHFLDYSGRISDGLYIIWHIQLQVWRNPWHATCTCFFKGHLLCNIHFSMSFIHVSPLCKEILKVSGKNICSLYFLI